MVKGHCVVVTFENVEEVVVTFDYVFKALENSSSESVMGIRDIVEDNEISVHFSFAGQI